MRRLLTFAFMMVASTILYAQQLALPFASPPYGRNGNLAIALEITPTIDALSSGAVGLSFSVEGAPGRTSKYSLKGEFSYFHMDAKSLFSPSMFISGSGGASSDILDFMFLMRAYPTAQSINTFFFGLGMGINLVITSPDTSFGAVFANFSSSTVWQPEVEFETGYKFRLIRNFFVEPSMNYKLLLPPPGVSLSANVPIYTFLTTSSSGPLSGIEFALSAGLEF